VSVCKVDSPNPGAGSNIKDTMNRLAFWENSREEFPIERQLKQMVLEIKAVLLDLIVGSRISSILISNLV